MQITAMCLMIPQKDKSIKSSCDTLPVVVFEISDSVSLPNETIFVTCVMPSSVHAFVLQV